MEHHTLHPENIPRMQDYDHKKIESKWQKIWEKKKVFAADDSSTGSGQVKSKKPKFYGLIEFPYPSGEGLHVGHIRSNTAMDVISRKRRMEGFNVLYPIGWDAFGLPTENYAIKTGIHPSVVTKKNTDTFRRQLKELGFSFDWSREINTTDPAYYKWTQWIFLKFLEKGLAYKKKMAINWCPKDKIGLANEEVVTRSTSSGQAAVCERCGTPVEKRDKEQWMLAITKYADRLDKDLDTVNFLEKIKIQQRNWIGKKEGINITYQIDGSNESITVFTTRPDTNYGATFVVLAPENELVEKIVLDENKKDVLEYIKKTQSKSEEERIAEGRKKTGVFTGRYAINHLTGKKMPIWVSDFVLAGFGTGAVVGVPGHDIRDFEFAKEFDLEIIRVVVGKDRDASPITRFEQVQEKEGTMINSDILNGLEIHEATKKIMDCIVEKGWGKKVVTYHLRDWVFSRQRYWGEPIPVIHCATCGIVPVPEKDLPVELPKVEKYLPTDTGESPLAAITKWVNTKCPRCGGPARRETDTMPNWAGSSWYYLRYIDPKNKKVFARPEALKYWTPVDWYNGGMEHTTLHLLYSRFWHKFLFDLGLVPTNEPYLKRTSHGLILAEDGTKMAKSRPETLVNPDKLIETFGADTLRLYEMFMGPFDQQIAWSTESMVGPRRFLEKVWRIGENVDTNTRMKANNANDTNKKLESLVHKTVKKVGEDIEAMRFNTAISALMICANEMDSAGGVSKDLFEMFLKILSPFAPHIAEELWQQLGNKNLIATENWPMFDPTKIADTIVTIIVQINGKVRGQFSAVPDISESEAVEKAKSLPEIKKWIGDKPLKKAIFVKGRLVNIVIGD